MSLNWKEINLILDELDLKGAQIQSAVQSAYDVMILRLHRKGETKQVLVSLSSGACRINETFRAVPKSDKPLRFAQFLSSKIVNGWITDINQLGDNRIVRIDVKRASADDEPPVEYRLYIRLWSNAANFIVTDKDGVIMDVMRRQPKRGEVTGGLYAPEKTEADEKPERLKPLREFEIREFDGEGSFNKKIDEFYAAQGGTLSLEVLREQARRNCEGSLGRIAAALERLREKEKAFANAEQLKIKGDEILSGLGEGKNSAKMAQGFYEQYKKEKSALAVIQREITQGEQELIEVTEKLERLLAETNPLILAKLLKSGSASGMQPKTQISKKEKSRPGLTFKRGDWQIIVGRDANENDELLRRHVKGNDLWLHARDYHGSHVFIRQRTGKTVPLDILLDAGNLAIFYSKGRNNGAGDLFYTQVKYLRRVKDGPKGLVIPTQEKNLHVKLDDVRLRALENCRVM